MASKNLDGVLIKKAHQKENYTLEQLQHLEKCMDPVNGALYFCKNFLKIQHPTRGAITFEPYEFQERLIQAYNDNTYSIAMLPRQMGKALCNQTPVLTPTGFKKMGELQVGDTIYTPKGTPTEVTFITETMTNRTCYEIEFAHGESIIADAHHLWTWYDPLYNDLITENTEYLIKRFNKYKTTNQRLSIDHTKPIEFEKKPLKLDPYLVGLWMGNNPEVNKLKCYNFEYQRYQEMFKSHGLTMSELKLNRHSNRLGTYTVNNLEYMVKPVLNSDNTLPEDLMMNDIETRVKLLSGIMDACGSVEETGYCTFKHNDEKITEQVRFMLSTLGVKSVLKVEHCKFKTNYYLKFATTAFRLFTLSEKVDNATNSNHWPTNERIYIKNITKAPSVPVRCLQVADKKHLFLVGKTLIPTHNTTCACGYLLWYTMFVPEAQVLIAAHKYAGAQDIMNRYRYGYENLPDFIRAGVYSYNRNTIEYDNGARIQATTTTENTGRGKSLSLIYCDEFSFVSPPEKAKEFWTALSPTLSTGGRCILTSTPNSDEDQFALIWHDANKKFDNNGIEQKVGMNGFFPFQAQWQEHPDRDEAWATLERNKIGSERFLREFCCEFLINDETLINATKLAELKGVDPTFTMGQTRWYKEIDPRATYLVSLDPSLGTGGDYAAMQVFEMPSMIQVGEWRHNTTPVQTQIRHLRDILMYIHDRGIEKGGFAPTAYYTMENNTLGEAALIVIESIGEENFHGLFLSEPIKKGHIRKFRKGFNTTHRTKVTACSQFKNLLETGKMTINSKVLVSELKTYISRGVSFGAKSGEHDDLIAALLLIIRMATVLADWDPTVYDKMSEKLSEDQMPLPIFISSGF